MENRLSELEGVIKYRLEHQYAELGAQLDISELNAWRSLFYRLRLVGQIPEKYGGLGFGNISRRLVPGEQGFLISGTQTGHLPVLNKQHFALITSASPEANAIQSRGISQPSSEALTHASVYRQHPSICAVVHVHCPELWLQTDRLALAYTSENVPYGTPDMARAVAGLFDSGRLQHAGIFSMLGHEDGIVAFGRTLCEASQLLIEQFAKAIAIEQNQARL